MCVSDACISLYVYIIMYYSTFPPEFSHCRELPRYASEFSVEIHTLRKKSFVGRENIIGKVLCADVLAVFFVVLVRFSSWHKSVVCVILGFPCSSQ